MSRHPVQPVRDLDVDAVAAAVDAGAVLLVDVRELPEIAMGMIEGAVVLPLSRFDPREIPDPEGRQVVFYCASGIRSVQASEVAQTFGFPYTAHLAGGIKAWAIAGMPVARG